MKTQHPAVVIMAVVILSLSACSKRDRDEAKKTGDGTETFRYVPRDPSKFMKKSPAEGGTHASAKPERKNQGAVEQPKVPARDQR
jgi:hypothetical protein